MALSAETDIAPLVAENAAAHPQPTVEAPPLGSIRASVLFEVTPNRYFSAGVGIGVHHLPVGVFEEAPPADTDAVIVPLRLAFNLPLSAYARKNRTAISLEANLMPGFAYAGLPVEYGQRFEFGILGGLGFELY
jgi:hypothetical protein